MNAGDGIAALRRSCHELWRKGTLVASIAYVLARETRAANPDEALVAGLMHNIGELYIAVRAHQHGAVLGADDAATRYSATAPANCGRHPRPLEVRAVNRIRGRQPKHDRSAGGRGRPAHGRVDRRHFTRACVFYRGCSTRQ